jgi:hypothetical protein
LAQNLQPHGRCETAEITIEAGTYQITVADSLTITAPSV